MAAPPEWSKGTAAPVQKRRERSPPFGWCCFPLLPSGWCNMRCLVEQVIEGSHTVLFTQLGCLLCGVKTPPPKGREVRRQQHPESGRTHHYQRREKGKAPPFSKEEKESKTTPYGEEGESTHPTPLHPTPKLQTKPNQTKPHQTKHRTLHANPHTTLLFLSTLFSSCRHAPCVIFFEKKKKTPCVESKRAV